MWCSKPFRALAVVAVTLPMSGCLRPLYGPTASGVPVQASLGAIEIDKIVTPLSQERLSHYLRSELIFDLNGSGTTTVKKYRLVIDAAENVTATTVDAQTGRADAAMLNVTTRYRLVTLDGSREVSAGTVRTAVTYNRDPQRFASSRAARDAEIRAAKQISEELRTRLATLFATSP